MRIVEAAAAAALAPAQLRQQEDELNSKLKQAKNSSNKRYKEAAESLRKQLKKAEALCRDITGEKMRHRRAATAFF